MARIAKTMLQTLLKAVNAMFGIGGIAMIMYGLWMVGVWQKEMGEWSQHDSSPSTPWFIYIFLGVGVLLCTTTCASHISADSANGFSLSCYTVIISSFLLMEMAMSVILLNSNWEKGLPEDPTGRFKDFKDFVKSEFDICKWVGLAVVSTQLFSILLAFALKAFASEQPQNHDSDKEYTVDRLPLLTPYTGALETPSWSLRKTPGD